MPSCSDMGLQNGLAPQPFIDQGTRKRSLALRIIEAAPILLGARSVASHCCLTNPEAISTMQIRHV